MGAAEGRATGSGTHYVWFRKQSPTIRALPVVTTGPSTPYAPFPRSHRLLGYGRPVVRLGSWSRPAGGSPVRVGAGAPGSRPRLVVERRRVERGVESLFGGSKRVGWDCSLVRSTVGEPSRSCHGEGHVRQSWFRIGCGGSLRGMETCTRVRSDRNKGDPSVQPCQRRPLV